MRVELSSLADTAVAAMLTRRGFALAGYENVLGLALTPDVVSAFARERDAARWSAASIVIAGRHTRAVDRDASRRAFASPDVFDGPPPTESFARESLERIFADFSAAPGCRLYSRAARRRAGRRRRAADRRRPGATGGRRRRCRRTAAAACSRRCCARGWSQRPTPAAISPSSPPSPRRSRRHNVQRAGFALLYVRAILVRVRRAEMERI